MAFLFILDSFYIYLSSSQLLSKVLRSLRKEIYNCWHGWEMR